MFISRISRIIWISRISKISKISRISKIRRFSKNSKISKKSEKNIDATYISDFVFLNENIVYCPNSFLLALNVQMLIHLIPIVSLFSNVKFSLKCANSDSPSPRPLNIGSRLSFILKNWKVWSKSTRKGCSFQTSYFHYSLSIWTNLCLPQVTAEKVLISFQTQKIWNIKVAHKVVWRK